MKKSIRLKLIAVMAAILVTIVLFFIILNTLTLETFYLYTEKKQLIEQIEIFNELYKNKSDEDIKLAIEKYSRDNNANITILDKDLNVIFDSAIVRFQRDFNPDDENSRPPQRFIRKQNFDMVKKLGEGKNYVINQVYEERLNSYFIELSSKLENGNYFIIHSSINSIQKNAAVSNRFILISAFFAFIIGSILMVFISGRFTKPILQLSKVAHKMSELDFSDKYKVKGEDELAVLGNSINTLSNKLEATINRLVKSNNELSNDIAKKEQIDAMRTEFLSSVSHELKTPIALIGGYAEGLKENIAATQESRSYYCDVILDEAMKMDALVRRLLDLNQLEYGKNEMSVSRFDINALLSDVIKKNASLTDIKIEFNPTEQKFVSADEFLIEQVISNIISNAINHVDDKKIIRVETKSKDNKLRVNIYNSGKNIDGQHIDKIWESFYKADKARTREYGGSGLGLAIVKAIMRQHNNECGVINEDDGVTFWFELNLFGTV